MPFMMGWITRITGKRCGGTVSATRTGSGPFSAAGLPPATGMRTNARVAGGSA